MSDPRRVPPGPRGHLLFGSLPELKQDWIGYLRACEHKYGSIVRLRMPWPIKELIYVGDRSLAERIFLDDADSFQNSRFTRRMAQPVLGNGLLLAEGEAWRRQRRLVQPAFHRARVASYVAEMRACADAMVDAWPDARERDVYADTLALTVRVAARTLFGAKLDAEAARASAALEAALAAFDAFKSSRLPLPLAIPTPNGLRLRRATRELESFIYDAIEQRRRSGEERDDLLSMLLSTRDADGTPLSDRQIRDEAITAFAGGTETIAITLAWAFYLLAGHAPVAQRIRAEVAEVAGNDPIGADHIAGLRYTESVVKETMRLFPPVWRSSREAVRDYTLDGFTIKRGTQVIVSQYLQQHDPKHFQDPERFAPERWSDELSRSLPKLAYFPFGVGRRTCIGQSFAMVELVVALATVAARVRFELTDRRPQRTVGSMLRPKAGVQLRILKG